MIASLRGRLAAVGEDTAVIDVGGVGYLVHCAARTLSAMPRTGDEVNLHIETQVREDSITLYGFLAAEERIWFRMLQNIQGVGARLALAILGVLDPESLVLAVAAQDRRALTRAPGVGPKLAARIIAELEERIGAMHAAPSAAPVPGTPPSASAVDEAVSALVNLGFGRADAFAAVSRAHSELGDAAGVDALVRSGLGRLGAT